VHPEDRAATRKALEQIFSDRPVKNFENRYQCKDNSYINLEWTAIAQPDDGMLYAVARDITKREKTENELKRLKSILNNTNDFISTSDLDGNIIYTNPLGLELVGKAGNVPQKMHITDYHSPEMADKIFHDYLPIVKETGIWAGELELLHSDGSIIPIDGVIMRVTDDTGSPVGYGAIYRDIRERKKARERLEAIVEDRTRELSKTLNKLKKSEERFDLAMQGANDGLWDWNLVTNEVYFTPRWKTMLGYTDDELENCFDTWAMLVHPEDIISAKKSIEEYLSGKTENYQIEFRMKQKLGHYANILSRGFAVRDELSGKPVRLIGTHVDITERKQAEEKLKAARDELARSNRDLEHFAYVASHDLQEPLRMVSSYLQLLESRYKDKLDEDALEFIHYAVDGAARMRTLITDLLAISRVGTKGKPFETMEMATALDAAISNLERLIQNKEAIITNDTLPDVYADSGQMVQLLQNLIGNAIKFHKPDEAPQIHISVEQKNNECLFSIKDNGIGIDKKYNDRIFSIFQRLHTAQEYSGTGIGLAICKRIVERHGGRIWVESEPGKGATFYFTLTA
jgi:PAS domain S-box-containing protein